MKGKKKVYEVYICKYNGETVYVGEGAFGRHKHCVSGTSHVYELNEFYFLGDRSLFDVKVKLLKSKEEARQLERVYIEKYRPKFNKVFVNNNRGEKGVKCSKLKRTMIDYLGNFNVSESKKQKLKTCFDQYLTYHSYDSIRDNGLVLHKHSVYRNIGLLTLGYTVNGIKHGSMNNNTVPYLFKTVLEACYFNHFGKECEIEML